MVYHQNQRNCLASAVIVVIIYIVFCAKEDVAIRGGHHHSLHRSGCDRDHQL